PVYGHGPSLEEFTDATPLTVGSPQEVIDKTLSFADSFGHYQRQLFLMDHAGLPLKTVLEQLDMLGEILPTLRAEFDKNRPAHIPEGPTHAAQVEAAGGPVDLTPQVEIDLHSGSAVRRTAEQSCQKSREVPEQRPPAGRACCGRRCT